MVTEEMDPGQEEEKAPEQEQGEDTAAEQEPIELTKVVINHKEDKAVIGISSPNCDPVFTVVRGSLADALARVPELVAEANRKWDAEPRYPKADIPAPELKPTPAASGSRSTSRLSSPKETAQPSFF